MLAAIYFDTDVIWKLSAAGVLDTGLWVHPRAARG
jgi:hypothetical protein